MTQMIPSAMRAKIDRWVKQKLKHVRLRREDMHRYQGEVVEFAKLNPFSLILMDMGLGKSISMLTLVADLLADDAYDHVLVIGPMRVATQTWPNEIDEWAHTAHLNANVIRADENDPRIKEAMRRARSRARLAGKSPGECSTSANLAKTTAMQAIRIELCHKPASVHIISYDWLEWLVNYWGPKWPYRFVVVDEASGLKNVDSNRFKALAQVRKHPGLITRMHLLTATPAAETYEHFYALMYFMDRGEAFGTNITKFRKEFFTKNIYTKTFEIRPNGDKGILERIAPYAIVCKKEDHLNLKEPTIIRRYVTMSDSEMALYNEMAAESVVKLPSGREVEAETAVALSAKLRQMASGVLYETFMQEGEFDFDEDEEPDMKKVKEVHHIHDQKIEELKQIMSENEGHPILVAYSWHSTREKLKKHFPKATQMDRAGTCVKPWNKKKIPMLYMHPKSGGHGLNLQRGGAILVIMDPFHSLELYQQLIGRLARQGQSEVVRVFILMTRDTLDEAVVDAVQGKEVNQDRMFRMLKKMIKDLQAKRERELALVDDEL